MEGCDIHSEFTVDCEGCVEELVGELGLDTSKWRAFSDKERIAIKDLLFEDYCDYCGRYNGDSMRACQCWNDE